MIKPEFGASKQPFPVKRPEVRIEPSSCEPFVVILKRNPSFGVAMERGAEAWMAWYDPPDWMLTSVTYQYVSRCAQVHGLDGLEIETREWEGSKPAWCVGQTHFARLTEEHFEWLATSKFDDDDKRVLYTFLDEGFDEDWGRVPRRIEDTGKLVFDGKGYTFELSKVEAKSFFCRAGFFDVTVGTENATCIRSILIELAVNSSIPSEVDRLERNLLVEYYYTRDGRLFLERRYNGRLWSVKGTGPIRSKAWDERFPENARLVINGAMFVHWYDCLTDASVAVDFSGPG
jgi:hypothetical protein